ncbi:hypothetical protein [Micromonospora sp. WMMD1082]|uniref:hypothetical protein n=1 Tax=Micromonospora sp. WMMD1082 TaxID=3016104 RepID=UPI0024160496|nr:hypothetical protein [Micromonospora sp. WMMD1082]MDG4798578.1 hypothetical protein [Micromonospora sp. WMMD1082]
MTAVTTRSWGVLAATLVTLVTGVAAGIPAAAADRERSPSPAPSASGSIGIRLVEASADRHDDPRARVYIVDHVKPGSRMTRRIEVSNTSDSPHRITLSAGAAEIRNHEFMPAPEPNDNELPSWITIDEPVIMAEPHSTTVVRATIDVPPSASRGERYGAIWATVSGADGQDAAMLVRRVNRVGIRVYLDVGRGGEPPSDFRIEELVPGRTEQGAPVVRARVRNTGERALDLSGKLWLSDGPGGLSAGPFPARLGTTVLPGDTAQLEVVLDPQLPNGPWQARLRVESGRIHREVTARITFPDRNGSWGLPTTFSERLPMIIMASGAVATVAGLVLFLGYRRSRRRTQFVH